MFRAAINAQKLGLLPFQVSGLIALESAGILNHQASEEVTTSVLRSKERLALDHELNTAMQLQDADYYLFTYNRIVGSGPLAHFPQSMLNIHFSLLPAFPGFHPIRRQAEGKVSPVGLTIHIITAEIDCGPVIAQAAMTPAPNITTPELGTLLFRLAVPLQLNTLALLQKNQRLSPRDFPITQGSSEPIFKPALASPFTTLPEAIWKGILS